MTRVIGLGSPFGDDRAGWRVLQRLRGRVPERVDLVELDRPGAALINWLDGIGHLVLVDAVSGPRPDGTLVKLDPDALPRSTGAFSSHGLALGETLELAERLHCRPTILNIFGIFISNLENETKIVSNACDVLAERIERRLQQAPMDI